MKSDRPIGPVIENWTPPPAPEAGLVLDGRYARLVALDADAHAALLFRAFDGHDWVWDYMPVGPFASAAQFHRWMRESTQSRDPLFFAIQNKETGDWGGFASYLRITPAGRLHRDRLYRPRPLPAADPRRHRGAFSHDAMGL